MSSILDALKKSERQRSLGRDLIFRNASPDATVRLTGFAVAVLAALLVLAVALAVLLYSLRETQPPSPTSMTAAEAPDPTADRVARTAEESPATTTTADPVPATRTQTARSVDNKTLSTSRTVVPMAKPVTTKPLPSLDTPRTPIQPPPATANGDVPWLSSLPASFRSNLPPLSVNIHVYSPEESQRILYINNRPAKQGERIEGGVVVEEIVHDGVVLQFRGQRFKLPRPS